MHMYIQFQKFISICICIFNFVKYDSTCHMILVGNPNPIKCVMYPQSTILILICILNMDDDCPICYETLCTGETRTTDCNHIFHRQCLRHWVTKKKVYGPVPCPMCRTTLKKPTSLPVRINCIGITHKGTQCKFKARIGKTRCGHHINQPLDDIDLLWLAIIAPLLPD